MTQVQASAVKADAEMDVSPETLKALSPFQDTSQAFITVLDNDSLTGVQVNLDLTLIGGGVTAYVEGAAWNAGTTAALSATALAAAMNADMVAQGGTAVAVDETVVLTTNNGTDFAIFPTVGSDDPTVLLINDAWGSGLEPFHSFWDSEFNGGDNIAMNANDYLHLYLVFAIVAGSTVTQVQLRLRYGMGETINRPTAATPIAGSIAGRFTEMPLSRRKVTNHTVETTMPAAAGLGKPSKRPRYLPEVTL